VNLTGKHSVEEERLVVAAVEEGKLVVVVVEEGKLVVVVVVAVEEEDGRQELEVLQGMTEVGQVPG